MGDFDWDNAWKTGKQDAMYGTAGFATGNPIVGVATTLGGFAEGLIRGGLTGDGGGSGEMGEFEWVYDPLANAPGGGIQTWDTFETQQIPIEELPDEWLYSYLVKHADELGLPDEMVSVLGGKTGSAESMSMEGVDLTDPNLQVIFQWARNEFPDLVVDISQATPHTDTASNIESNRLWGFGTDVINNGPISELDLTGAQGVIDEWDPVIQDQLQDIDYQDYWASVARSNVVGARKDLDDRLLDIDAARDIQNEQMLNVDAVRGDIKGQTKNIGDARDLFGLTFNEATGAFEGYDPARQGLMDTAAGYGGQLSYLDDVISGNAPSVAVLERQRAMEQAQRQALSLAASSRDPGAWRAAMDVGNEASNQAARDAAIIRAQEIATATGQRTEALGGMANTYSSLGNMTTDELAAYAKLIAEASGQVGNETAIYNSLLGYLGNEVNLYGETGENVGREIGLYGEGVDALNAEVGNLEAEVQFYGEMRGMLDSLGRLSDLEFQQQFGMSKAEFEAKLAEFQARTGVGLDFLDLSHQIDVDASDAFTDLAMINANIYGTAAGVGNTVYTTENANDRADADRNYEMGSTALGTVFDNVDMGSNKPVVDGTDAGRAAHDASSAAGPPDPTRSTQPNVQPTGGTQPTTKPKTDIFGRQTRY